MDDAKEVTQADAHRIVQQVYYNVYLESRAFF